MITVTMMMTVLMITPQVASSLPQPINIRVTTIVTYALITISCPILRPNNTTTIYESLTHQHQHFQTSLRPHFLPDSLLLFSAFLFFYFLFSTLPLKNISLANFQLANFTRPTHSTAQPQGPPEAPKEFHVHPRCVNLFCRTPYLWRRVVGGG